VNSTIDFYVLLAVSLAWTFIGWAIVYLSSRIERRRRERHAERSGEHRVVESPALTKPWPWIRFVRSWLLP
jgi:hypothetical protein